MVPISCGSANFSVCKQKKLKNKANQENMHMKCEDNGPSWYNLEFAVEYKKMEQLMSE